MIQVIKSSSLTILTAISGILKVWQIRTDSYLKLLNKCTAFLIEL